ncbi:hypothetical protein [Mycobacterium sp. DBP42]|uniref:hypothetical protein n=1 Tax=Mycobacteriaceae TaxID=1762 RepID=UPI00352F9F59
MIRNLPAALHHRSVEAEARAILTAGLSGEDVPMSVLLAADTGHDIDFDPERDTSARDSRANYAEDSRRGGGLNHD